MADHADVRSVDAVRDWLAQLATYGETLAEALSGVELEIRRGFDWLDEQLGVWRRAVRECEQDVTQARAELSARQFTDWNGRVPDTTVQEKALRRAKARLEYAEEQVERIRRWSGRLPKLIEEAYRGPAHRLGTFIDIDLRAGRAHLDRRLAALESYAGLRPDYAPVASDPAPAPASPGPKAGGDDAGEPRPPGRG